MSADEIVAVDFRGHEIRVGDTVLYPRMSGRSCEMTEARVERIDVVLEGRMVSSPEWDAWAAIPWQEREDWDKTKPRQISVPAWRFSLMPLRSTRFSRWTEGKAVFIRIGENVVAAP